MTSHDNLPPVSQPHPSEFPVSHNKNDENDVVVEEEERVKVNRDGDHASSGRKKKRLRGDTAPTASKRHTSRGSYHSTSYPSDSVYSSSALSSTASSSSDDQSSSESEDGDVRDPPPFHHPHAEQQYATNIQDARENIQRNNQNSLHSFHENNEDQGAYPFTLHHRIRESSHHPQRKHLIPSTHLQQYPQATPIHVQEIQDDDFEREANEYADLHQGPSQGFLEMEESSRRRGPSVSLINPLPTTRGGSSGELMFNPIPTLTLLQDQLKTTFALLTQERNLSCHLTHTMAKHQEMLFALESTLEQRDAALYKAEEERAQLLVQMNALQGENVALMSRVESLRKERGRMTTGQRSAFRKLVQMGGKGLCLFQSCGTVLNDLMGMMHSSDARDLDEEARGDAERDDESD